MMERASAREVWRETRPLTREVQWLYVGAAVAVIVSTLITLAGPALVRYAIDNGVDKNDLHPIDVAAVAILVLALIKPFVVRAQTLLAATASERFLDRLRGVYRSSVRFSRRKAWTTRTPARPSCTAVNVSATRSLIAW